MAGLPGVSPRRRRIPGLRRDELARLLGVDTQYYTDLEQGLLAQAPEARLRDLVADVLALTREERERLAELLEDSYPANLPCRLLYAPVLEWGGRFNHQPKLLEFAFLDEETARGFWPDWKAVTTRALADLRAAVSDRPDDPEPLSVVGNLTARSRSFCRMWLDEDLPPRSSHSEETIFNPFIGVVTVPFRMLEDDDGAQAVAFAPSPGSAAHTAMQRLEVWANAG
ncbi:MAG: helix-turn-helix domain-containing protein [Actinomyces sp.]|uniref:MmyB family transcriptional regulator n=1 Tax=Actinomyces sp. TaxID=29317 RepID=UPI0026DC047A|nr:helix-turn-helix domain-containing protein [Actinomyces sp.]MDO4242583.1 helix-turn-helix domain-containing protein [Actinomyces sp.]